MKVGVNLINFGPSAQPDTLHRWVRVTEELGYHSMFTSDHVATTDDVRAQFPDPFYEPTSTLGWLVGMSSRLILGTTVTIVPYRSPFETARAIANLDQLSGGRIVFGAGVGWAEQEFDLLGLPFAERGPMTDDYLAAIIAMWTNDTASHHGDYVSFDDLHVLPRPVQQPHPPIWIGGSGPAALRRAVTVGSAWHPIRLRWRWLREVGLPRLDAAVSRHGGTRPAICPRIGLNITDQSLDQERRMMGEGTLEQIHDDLRGLEELGCEHVLLDSTYDGFEGTLDPERTWRDLETLATQALDLAGETVR